MSSSQLSIAIVGLPNVGKSTLFNALLKKQVALAANYPFATIEPNVGVVPVPDERLSVLAKIVKTQVVKPALVEFVDVAGLVKGASQGAGLGNQFLAHIRETQAICHVVRGFSDSTIIREGSVDPKEDLATVRTELQLADLNTLEKQKEPKGRTEPALLTRWRLIQQLKQRLAKGLPAIDLNSSLVEEELALAKELCLLTTKKELVVVNVDEDQLKDQGSLQTEYAQKLALNPNQVVIISAKIESELSALPLEDQQQYLKELGLMQTGLERLAAGAYQTLGLQSFLTAGVKEVKAWTIPQGITAVKAAGVIHTDFEQKFIKAKVVSYQDFVQFGGWQQVKELGKIRLEGRDYVMKEGDLVEFMIGS